MNASSPTRLQLADGRQLDVFESGSRDGEVLVFHHGTPGSCRPMRLLIDSAHRLGLRFVATSRPGYGGSTRRPGRSVADVVPDTDAVLDAVGVDRCRVIGWSGGGPHALACGALLPQREAAVLVIASVAPNGAEGLDFLAGMGEDNLVEFGHAVEGETTLRRYLDEARAGLMAATPAELMEAMRSLLPPADLAAFTESLGADLSANMQEGLRTGVDGWLDDDLAFVQPWGFELHGVGVPTLLWQGSEDLMVPVAHGRWLSERIPRVTAHIEEGHGHLSIAAAGMERMLRDLVATA